MGSGKIRWLLPALLMAVVGCGSFQKETPAQVSFSTEDTKLLAAFDTAPAEESKQTDLLARIADGQERLLERLEDSAKLSVSGATPTSLPLETGHTSKEAAADTSTVVKDSKPVKSNDSEWPSGYRLQVWDDGSSVAKEWIETELPGIDVTPEMFNVGSAEAARQSVATFTIMLVKDGQVRQRYQAPFSAAQLTKFAKEDSDGPLVASAGSGGTCQCPNCDCMFSCNTSTSTRVSNPVAVYSRPTFASTQFTSVPTTTSWTVRSSQPRMECRGNKCFLRW
jgi:hypothetical protein